METAEHGEDSSVLVSKVRVFVPSLLLGTFYFILEDEWLINFLFVSQENHGKSRKMITLMDYADPEPNVNPRTGYILTPPPQLN